MKQVCVIDDNLPIRKLFSTIIKKQGFETTEFADGSSAIVAFNEKRFTPNLIIMDNLLPDINGTDLIKQVRSIAGLSDVPIIAVTGNSTAQDKMIFESLGFNEYLVKPIGITELISVVNKYL